MFPHPPEGGASRTVFDTDALSRMHVSKGLLVEVKEVEVYQSRKLQFIQGAWDADILGAADTGARIRYRRLPSGNRGRLGCGMCPRSTIGLKASGYGSSIARYGARTLNSPYTDFRVARRGPRSPHAVCHVWSMRNNPYSPSSKPNRLKH
jgi:hypothetical protein